ncbi:MAG: DUF2218 domain-containing protein [Oricola sp.]
MQKATACFRTKHGRKYLVQLCKHFAHRVEVEYTPERGRCVLSPGQADMVANDDGITFVVSAEDDAGLARAKDIVTQHLVRFAYRENLRELSWSAA